MKTERKIRAQVNFHLNSRGTFRGMSSWDGRKRWKPRKGPKRQKEGWNLAVKGEFSHIMGRKCFNGVILMNCFLCWHAYILQGIKKHFFLPILRHTNNPNRVSCHLICMASVAWAFFARIFSLHIFAFEIFPLYFAPQFPFGIFSALLCFMAFGEGFHLSWGCRTGHRPLGNLSRVELLSENVFINRCWKYTKQVF